MLKRLALSIFSLAVFSLTSTAQAQQPVTTTNGGSAGAVPVFTSGTNVENSVITQANGNVGIGTNNPGTSLQVNASSPYIAAITVVGDQSAERVSNSAGSILFLTGLRSDISLGNYVFYSYGGNWIFNGGNVGIGTTNPGATLEVNGGIKLTAGSNGSITFQDGTTQTTAFNPALCGADFAESVGVGSDRAKYEPGDLMVIDPDKPGSFLKSNQPYSTLVAGVYSAKPGFVGRKHPASDPASADEVPMAMVGRVPTKVSAENGPIRVGDLLVASSKLGYAMKGTDHDRMLGAVIGKALGPLDSGTGVIEVLVTLQ